jgi:hypothetical protein
MDNRIEQNSYDLHITPAETAARMEREGTEYKHIPEHEVQPDRKAKESSSTEGVTIDGEGLLNNYAIEPEIYYDVPGDRTAIIENEHAIVENEHEIAEKEQQQHQSEEE